MNIKGTQINVWYCKLISFSMIDVLMIMGCVLTLTSFVFCYYYG